MSNSGMPRAASNDDDAMELQQLILRSYKSMNGLVNFYNGQLHDELDDLMLSIQQEDQRQTCCTSDHTSQLTEALDLKCLAGINKLSQYLMIRPSCSSLDLSDGPKFRQL